MGGDLPGGMVALHYTPRHMATLLRRAAATGVKLSSLVKILVTFARGPGGECPSVAERSVSASAAPRNAALGLLGGEHALLFWPRFIAQSLVKHTRIAGMIVRLSLLGLAIGKGRDAGAYMDEALTPVGDDDDAALELMTLTAGGDAAFAHARKIAGLTRAAVPL